MPPSLVKDIPVCCFLSQTSIFPLSPSLVMDIPVCCFLLSNAHFPTAPILGQGHSCLLFPLSNVHFPIVPFLGHGHSCLLFPSLKRPFSHCPLPWSRPFLSAVSFFQTPIFPLSPSLVKDIPVCCFLLSNAHFPTVPFLGHGHSCLLVPSLKRTFSHCPLPWSWTFLSAVSFSQTPIFPLSPSLVMGIPVCCFLLSNAHFPTVPFLGHGHSCLLFPSLKRPFPHCPLPWSWTFLSAVSFSQTPIFPLSPSLVMDIPVCCFLLSNAHFPIVPFLGHGHSCLLFPSLKRPFSHCPLPWSWTFLSAVSFSQTPIFPLSPSLVMDIPVCCFLLSNAHFPTVPFLGHGHSCLLFPSLKRPLSHCPLPWSWTFLSAVPFSQTPIFPLSPSLVVDIPVCCLLYKGLYNAYDMYTHTHGNVQNCLVDASGRGTTNDITII